MQLRPVATPTVAPPPAAPSSTDGPRSAHPLNQFVQEPMPFSSVGWHQFVPVTFSFLALAFALERFLCSFASPRQFALAPFLHFLVAPLQFAQALCCPIAAVAAAGIATAWIAAA